MQFRALYWWIDRWRKSTAYTDMNLEEQAAYRNLLDEATLRGGPLPVDERILAKACGDATRWRSVRKNVLKRFRKTRDGWRNATLDANLHQAAQRMAKQQRYRTKQRIAGLNPGNGDGNDPGNEPGSPDQDQDQTVRTPLPPFAKGGRLTRAQLNHAKDIRARVHGGCPHAPRCPDYAACVRLLALEAKAQAV